jgi:hypothetical protein
MGNGKLEIGHGLTNMNCALNSLKDLLVAKTKVLNNAGVPSCFVLILSCSTTIKNDYVIEAIEFDNILSP